MRAGAARIFAAFCLWRLSAARGAARARGSPVDAAAAKAYEDGARSGTFACLDGSGSVAWDRYVRALPAAPLFLPLTRPRASRR